MSTTTKVTITEKIRDLGAGKPKRYQVRWKVDGAPEKTAAFPTLKGAKTHQRRLQTAQDNGELWDRETREPVSWAAGQKGPTIAGYTRDFLATHWPTMQPSTRRSDVEEPAAWLPALVTREIADRATLYPMLKKALNPSETLTLAEEDLWKRFVKVSMPLASVKRVHMAQALSFCRTKLDGTPAAGTYGNRRRASLGQILIDAVANEHLDRNPLENYREPKSVKASKKVDVSEVGDAAQVAAVFQVLASSRYLVLYALMYFAGLRPSEAVAVRWGDFLDLPETGWGMLRLKTAAPEAGKKYTDNGKSRQEGGLKHREQGTVRLVPLAPVLCELLLAARPNKARRAAYVCHGRTKDDMVSDSTLDTTWKAARDQALPDVDDRCLYRSYSLRHSAASLWLSIGVSPAEIAERLGHSVEMLLSTYADVLKSHAAGANKRIDEELESAGVGDMMGLCVEVLTTWPTDRVERFREFVADGMRPDQARDMALLLDGWPSDRVAEWRRLVEGGMGPEPAAEAVRLIPAEPSGELEESA